MATISSTAIVGPPYAAGATWALANTDDGVAVDLHEYSDRSVQVSGTFGVGGTVVIEGSNNGTVWSTLRDPQGTTLSFTAVGLRAVSEMTRHIRPRVTAGDGTTALSVALFVRRTIR